MLLPLHVYAGAEAQLTCRSPGWKTARQKLFSSLTDIARHSKHIACSPNLIYRLLVRSADLFSPLGIWLGARVGPGLKHQWSGLHLMLPHPGPGCLVVYQPLGMCVAVMPAPNIAAAAARC